MDVLNALSSDSSVPVSLAVLVVQLAVLTISFYWFRKIAEMDRKRFDKELDEVREEIAKQAKENHETKELVIEMHTDIKWIKRTLTNKNG